MKLQDAAQASAAFPGGFPPRWFRTAPFRFQGGKVNPQVMVVSDGGVYDNMAEQWIVGGRSRAARPHAPRFHLSDTLTLVNAVIGAIFTMIRIMNVLYDNTTVQRRRALIEGSKARTGMPVTMVTIDQSPLTVAERLIQENDANDAILTLARGVVERFGAQAGRWNNVRRTSQQVGTTLRALGKANSANLLYHAYMVANVNSHLTMGYPLLDKRDLRSFEELVA